MCYHNNIFIAKHLSETVGAFLMLIFKEGVDFHEYIQRFVSFKG